MERRTLSSAGASRNSHRRTQDLGAVDFVRRLEEVLIRTCADFAIETKRIPGLTGVWTNPDTRHQAMWLRPLSAVRAKQSEAGRSEST